MSNDSKNYVVFCQEVGGGGTIWIDTVTAKNIATASAIAQAQCAKDWGWDVDDVHVLGVASGCTKILYWEDQE